LQKKLHATILQKKLHATTIEKKVVYVDIWRCILGFVFVLSNLDTSFRKTLTTWHFHITNVGGTIELSSIERREG